MPRRSIIWLLPVCLAIHLTASEAAAAPDEESNKELARRFYEQVWFSRNMAVVDEAFAPEYIAHDIGDRKGAREPASEQVLTAERFWRNGTMSGRIDYQIAEGDLVATRWLWSFQPRTWWAKALMLGGRDPIPVINVFRFQDGKIVEVWNHRHDIDVGFVANLLRIQGFVGGVALTLAVSAAARFWRRRRSAG